MTTFLDKLNLRPQERRWVMAVTVGVIIILNYLFIWPYFSESGKVRKEIAETQAQIKAQQEEIRTDDAPNTGYKAQLAKLEKKGDSVQFVGEVQLYNVISAQARGKVNISEFHPLPVRNTVTNDFYEEQSMQITVDSTEKELVDFIYEIGRDSSMIRVRELRLNPADVSRFRLKGQIVLSANYQKKPAASQAPAAKTPVGTKAPTGPKTPAATKAPAGPKTPPGSLAPVGKNK